MSVPKARLLDLMKVQCKIFSNVFNPDRLRTGNKVLRQRLKGPALEAYYPRKMATIKDLKAAYAKHGVQTYDEYEEERFERLTIIKARGKGAPKKKRTAAESKKFKGKKN